MDLKAAVRYLHFNKHRIPGNTDWIVSGGGSAGAALSSLLGASGDSPLYHRYLKEIGAAEESDAVFATAAYSPITDLEHADMAYEWMFGTLPLASGATAAEPYSTQLKDAYAGYLRSLHLRGIKGHGTLTADNYADYMVKAYLQPSATAYLTALPDADRTTYLAANTFITWSGGKATFTWDGFLTHIGRRMKNAPSFDALDASAFENQEFGDATTNARHFTLYSLRTETGNTTARLDADLPEKIKADEPDVLPRAAQPPPLPALVAAHRLPRHQHRAQHRPQPRRQTRQPRRRRQLLPLLGRRPRPEPGRRRHDRLDQQPHRLPPRMTSRRQKRHLSAASPTISLT
ncbi:hypothetical protein [Streptomyces sp. NPDC096132]|uniref:hypothetical protein n=1 Tax=Streptomyces sp. NPDC096132 TaxID=3366075 RepID=UPI0037F9AFE3